MPYHPSIALQVFSAHPVHGVRPRSKTKEPRKSRRTKRSCEAKCHCPLSIVHCPLFPFCQTSHRLLLPPLCSSIPLVPTQNPLYPNPPIPQRTPPRKQQLGENNNIISPPPIHPPHQRREREYKAHPTLPVPRYPPLV